MSFYDPQCGLSDAVKDLFYDQLHVRAVTTVIPAWEFLIPCGDWNVQAHVTKKYMEAVGMAGHTPRGGGGGRGGGGTLTFSYIRRLGPFFLGFKILNFNIFLGFQKNKYFFGYENFVDIFLGSSQNWTIFRGHFYAF